jgi:hypothetical protein
MLLRFLLIASSGSVPQTGSSHSMNKVRLEFQSEICNLKFEINMMVLKLARGVAVSTGGAYASNCIP